MTEIKKKLAVLCITAAMCISAVPAYAADTGAAGTADEAVADVPVVQSFTIDKAIEYAKENSRSMAALKAAETTAKAEKEMQRSTFKNLKTAIFNSEQGASDDSTYLILTGYVYRSYIFNYAVAQRSTIQKEYTLESDVKNAFYTYLNNVDQTDIARSALTSAEERVSSAEVKYKNGSISANDLENFKLAAVKARNDYNASVRKKDLSMMQLKSTLSYPQENELTITGSFERQPMDTTTPEEALEKAKNCINRVNVEETLALAKIKRDTSVSHYTSSSVGARSAKAEFAEAELNYYNAVEQERIGIYTAYNNMVTAYEALDYCDQSLAYTEKVVEASKRSYDLGLISSDDYLNAVQQLDSLKASTSAAELSAYLASVQYKLTYDCENTITQEEDALL